MFPFTTSLLPVELYSLLPIVLFAAVIALLFAARHEADSRGVRPLARSVGAIGLLTLFVSLYAAFGAVGAMTDLMVNHEKRARATISAESSEEFFYDDFGVFGVGLPVLFPLYDFTYDSDNNSNYSFIVASGLVALTAGSIFVFHGRARRRLEQDGADPVVARVGHTYHAGVSAVSALTLAVSVASMGYAVFEIAAPGITSAGFPSSVVRSEGIAELLAFAFLAAVSGLLLRSSWSKARPVVPLPVPSPRAKKATTRPSPATRKRAR